MPKKQKGFRSSLGKSQIMTSQLWPRKMCHTQGKKKTCKWLQCSRHKTFTSTVANKKQPSVSCRMGARHWNLKGIWFKKTHGGPATHHLIITLEYYLSFCEVGQHGWVTRVKTDDKVLFQGFSYMRRDRCQHTDINNQEPWMVYAIRSLWMVCSLDHWLNS